MKASERCREHFQGDRCRKALGHVEDEHKGAHNTWVVAHGAEYRTSCVAGTFRGPDPQAVPVELPTVEAGSLDATPENVPYAGEEEPCQQPL